MELDAGTSKIKISNSLAVPMDVGIEPVGMFYSVLPDDSVEIESDMMADQDLEIVRWDGGVSVWLEGGVSIRRMDGTLLGSF